MNFSRDLEIWPDGTWIPPFAEMQSCDRSIGQYFCSPRVLASRTGLLGDAIAMWMRIVSLSGVWCHCGGDSLPPGSAKER